MLLFFKCLKVTIWTTSPIERSKNHQCDKYVKKKTHFAFNEQGVTSRMRINYCVNNNPTLGHLDGLCVPIPKNLSNYFKKNANVLGLAQGGGGGKEGHRWNWLMHFTPRGREALSVRVKCLAQEHNTVAWPGLEVQQIKPLHLPVSAFYRKDIFCLRKKNQHLAYPCWKDFW